MTLAEKLLSLRTAKGLSQEELAERLGISRQSVSKWETGQSVPDLDKIIKLADLFGVAVDDLVREEERPRPPEPEVIYVERERKLEWTAARITGVVLECIGIGTIVVGLLGLGILGMYVQLFIGATLIISGLPLLLAKKHPFLITGWLLITESLLVLGPHTIGRLRFFALRAAVGIIQGTLILILLFFTGRAWRRARRK